MNTIIRGPYTAIRPLYQLLSSLSALGLNVSVGIHIRGQHKAHTTINKPYDLLNLGGLLQDEHMYLTVNLVSTPHVCPRAFCVTLDSLVNIVQPSPLRIPR